MNQNRNALVLGATGGIGGEVARRLTARGWTVRALHRDAARVAAGHHDRNGFTWLQGDALRPGDVVAAARGVSLIVHAVNPPGYRNWGALVLPMLDSTLAAARETGARILLPGTVYNYGPDTFPEIDETSPQHPVTRKGAIRVEMERRLRAAAANGEAKVLIVRAGDFFGPHTGLGETRGHLAGHAPPGLRCHRVVSQCPTEIGSQGFVVVGAEREPGQLACPCTLKLWEAKGPRTVTLGNVTFPPAKQGPARE